MPELAANLSADYDWQIDVRWRGFLGASYHFTGERRSDLRSEATSHSRVKLPSYDQIDMRAGVSFDEWTFDIFVKNAADEHGVVAVGQATLDDRSPIFGAAIIQPRTSVLR